MARSNTFAWSIAGLLAAMTVGLALALLAGYQAWTRPAAPRDKPTISEEERERLRIREGKHNYQVLSAGGWALHFWTNASVYQPRGCVGMGFQLVCQSPPCAPPEQARVRARIAPVANPGATREAEHTLTLARSEPGQDVWEARIYNVFPLDDDWRGGAILAEGHSLSDRLGDYPPKGPGVPHRLGPDRR
jgi:hypothetical protein